jgi:chaperonin cofactor prefoldin
MPSAQVQMLQLSTEEMRAASGQQNANFGIKSEAASGVGIQRLKAQGEIATFHFPDNLARALTYEMRVLVDLVPKIYDTKRIVRILGLDGKESKAVLDPEMEQPYAEAQGDVAGEVQKIFNPLMGRYDVAISTGPSYQTQRQEAADTLTELTSRNPQIMQVAGDIVMRSYDFPMAEEMAKRLEKTLPPNLLDKKEGEQELPPQVQQQMQEMQQQVEQLGQALEAAAKHADELEAESKSKQAELGIKAFEADTNRLKVIGTAMTPEQVQALVMQTVQQLLEAPAPAESVQEVYEEEPEMPEYGEPPEMPEQQIEQEAPQGVFFMPEEGLQPPQ